MPVFAAARFEAVLLVAVPFPARINVSPNEPYPCAVSYRMLSSLLSSERVWSLTVSPSIAKAPFVTAGGGLVRSRWSFLPIARAPGLAPLTIDNHKWGARPILKRQS